MEVALFLIFGLIVVFALLSSKGRADNRNHRINQRPPNPKPSFPTKENSSKTRRSSFDASATLQQPKKQVIRGSAYVVDGDTLVIRKTQVRLFGIDAPELNHPFGIKAKWALVSLCKGQALEARVTDQDTHGRTVAKCTLEDGRDLSAEMVKLGLAIDWPKYSNGKYRSLEVPGVRKKLWLADARQKGRIHVWKQFEARKKAQKENS